MLSRATATTIHIPLFADTAPLGREQVEALARPILERTLRATRAAISDAGLHPAQLAALFLVGGSSRIPLAATLLHQAFSLPPTTIEAPELAVALGSLHAVATAVQPATPTGPRTAAPPAGSPRAYPAPAPVTRRRVIGLTAAAAAVTVPAIAAAVFWRPGTRPTASWRVASRAPVRVAYRGALLGHGDAVLGVEFSPDGAILASASTDHTVRLWNTATGSLIRILTGHTDIVEDLAFSPDGRILASAGGSDGDHTVRLWDATTGAALATLDPGLGEFIAVAFSPDGSTVAAAAYHGPIQLWDARSHQPVRRLPGHKDGTLNLAFSPDGRILASSGYDDAVRLWAVADGSPVAARTSLSRGPWAIAFSPDGRLIVIDGDRALYLLDATTAQQVGIVHDDGLALTPVRTLAVSPDGTELLAAAQDHGARLYDMATRQLTRRLTDDWIDSATFSPDGTAIATGSEDGTVRIWDTPVRTTR